MSLAPGWAEPGRGLFSISVAAELAGVHPQTLRIYEREGLLDPARTVGGTRRYSADDIERLKEIITLTAGGLNLAGVRRVLELQEQTRQMQAEIDRLRKQAGQVGQPPRADDGGHPPGNSGHHAAGTGRPGRPGRVRG
ncbi:MAG: heat shock protein transcriptional repressor HspR [Streptosporangiaceae bacterium]